MSARQSPVSTEAIAGLTTFFTMAYIVVVNPSILSTEGTGIAFSGALTATVLTGMVQFNVVPLNGAVGPMPPLIGLNAAPVRGPAHRGI